MRNRKMFDGICLAFGLLALTVLFLPCLLIFSCGTDGELKVWNFVGMAWAALLFALFKWKPLDR